MVSPPDATQTGEEGLLSDDELRRRTSASLLLVSTRGIVVMGVGFGGNVVLAHLLTPRDFGVIAMGMALVLVGQMLSDGGLGAALIRRAERPRGSELGALTALQLGASAAVVAATAAVAAPIGGEAWVAAVMVLSLPLMTLQLPGRILLERSVRFGPLAGVEIAQVLAHNAAAIALVAAGMGVWGFAVAMVIRAAVSTVVMAMVSPVGLVRPRWHWASVRPLVGFGLRYQGFTATWLVRDQLLNAAIAIVATVATLGLWSLVKRVMELPYLFLRPMWRIAFPAMSQVVTGGKAVAPLIERAAGVAVISTGTVLVALTGSAPGLMAGVFGEPWREASTIIPWACLGLAIGGTVSAATQGYLYAAGEAGAVLRAGLAQAVAWFAVSLPLLPLVGPAAIGLGWVASGVAEAAVLLRATNRRTSVRLIPTIGPSFAIGVSAASAGWIVADRAGADLLAAVAGGTLAVALFHAGLMLVHRPLMRQTYAMVTAGLRSTRSPSAGLR
jgi:O-antigen/teichoic acid export membrane protein